MAKSKDVFTPKKKRRSAPAEPALFEKQYDTPAEEAVRLRAIEADLLGAPDAPDPDEAVAGLRECRAGRHDWDTDGEVDACIRPGCWVRVRRAQPDVVMPGVTRVPTPSRNLMVVRDLAEMGQDVPLHVQADFDQACLDSFVKVAPVVTGEQNATIDWADIERRIRSNGAAGVVIAPDVRRVSEKKAATKLPAVVSAEAAIREWAAGVKGAEPDELEDAVAFAISLATAAGLS